MADETKAASCGGGDSMKTVQALAIILICILAIFMVTSLNKVKAELVRLNQQMDVLVTTTAQNTLGGFQAVDEGGKVLYKFAPVPMVESPEAGMASPPGSAPAAEKK